MRKDPHKNHGQDLNVDVNSLEKFLQAVDTRF